MDLSIRTEENKRIERKKIRDFCERYGKAMVQASLEEILLKWTDFQYSRYQVNELEDGFCINDLENKELVAFISKQDPRAFTHAYDLCEKLNDPPKSPFLSVNGREITIEDSNPLIELNNNALVDFLIDSIEKDK